MGKITLTNMAEELAAKSGLSKEAADNFLHAIVDTIEKGLQNDKMVKIKGLGTFKLMDMSDRESVDVSTGERITIKGYTKVSFTPDSSMKEFVNRPFAHFEPTELNDGYPDEDVVIESEEPTDEVVVSLESEPKDVVTEERQDISEEKTTETSEPKVVEVVESTEEVKVVEVAEEVIDASETIESTEINEPTEPAESNEQIENVVVAPSEDPVSPDTETPQEEKKEEVSPEEVETAESPVAEIKEDEPSEPNTNIAEKKSKKRVGCWGIGCLVVLLIVAAIAAVGLYFTPCETGKREATEQEDIKVNPNLKDLVVTQKKKSADKADASVKTSDKVAEVKPKEDAVPVKAEAKVPSEEAKPVQTEPKTKPVTSTTTGALVITETLAAKNIKDITVADTTDYIIVGRLAAHELKEGETIIQLSRKYYGDKRLWPYIVKYNHITDFNKVAVGMSMNIPVLKTKTNE